MGNGAREGIEGGELGKGEREGGSERGREQGSKGDFTESDMIRTLASI